MNPTSGEIEYFSKTIRIKAKDNRIGLWEALNDYCEEIDMEYIVAASLLSESLKSDIMKEVEELNLLKKNANGARLPI